MALKSLAIATDLSERADPAMDRAIALAQEHNCALTIIHVVDDSLPDAMVSNQIMFAKEHLHDDVSQRLAGGKVDVAINVTAGDPFPTIVAETASVGADVLISGMHRKDTLQDFVAGTTIGRVIRSIGCPVLLVRNRAARKYENIVVATDFSPSSRFALGAAVSLAPSASYHLIHAYDIPFGGLIDSPSTRETLEEQITSRLNAFAEEEMAAIAERLSPGPNFARPRAIQGTILEVISDQAVSLKADMLVVGTHGRTGIGRMLLGSVAEFLIADPPTDLLIARAW